VEQFLHKFQKHVIWSPNGQNEKFYQNHAPEKVRKGPVSKTNSDARTTHKGEIINRWFKNQNFYQKGALLSFYPYYHQLGRTDKGDIPTCFLFYKHEVYKHG